MRMNKTLYKLMIDVPEIKSLLIFICFLLLLFFCFLDCFRLSNISCSLWLSVDMIEFSISFFCLSFIVPVACAVCGVVRGVWCVLCGVSAEGGKKTTSHRSYSRSIERVGSILKPIMRNITLTPSWSFFPSPSPSPSPSPYPSIYLCFCFFLRSRHVTSGIILSF